MLKALRIFAMTLFAVVVVHGFIYEQPCPLDLIEVQGTPIDTDQPHRRDTSLKNVICQCI